MDMGKFSHTGPTSVGLFCRDLGFLNKNYLTVENVFSDDIF